MMPRTVSAQSRTLGFDFWRVATYVINGTLFVLIGLQARAVLELFKQDCWQGPLLLGVLCAVTIFVVRLAWVALMAPIIRLVDRRPSQHERRVPFRTRLVLVWGGFRGAISLAAALAVPVATASGDPFPGREILIAATFIVIVLLLLGQGATMPLIVRSARIPDAHDDLDEFRFATVESIAAALAHLDADAADEGASEHARAEVQERLEQDLVHAREAAAESDANETKDAAIRRLLLRTVERKREEVERLRREGRIDDGVFLDVQRVIDHEELQLRHNPDD